MKKFTKQIIATLALFMMFAPVFATRAALTQDDLYGGKRADVESTLGMDGAKDPRVIVADIIRILLGFLGLLATLIIIQAGFQWMTAAGDKAKVDGAKTRMQQGVIGLIIILSAWALSNFVISQVLTEVIAV